MLNLLFITDSPKTESIKKELQPLLKVIIDVVTDFDNGLKDVFEKRPATVCIQDHIGGVSGESVARHIQMLLGSSAPTFILLHSGNDKAKVINGLFEHFIDVSLPNTSLVENILGTLKLLLGSQWDTVYIPPKSLPASAPAAVSAQDESRENAEKLMEDFTSEFETSNNPPVAESTPLTLEQVIAAKKLSRAAESKSTQDSEAGSGSFAPAKVQSSNDEVVDLLLAEVKKAEQADIASPASSDGAAEFGSVSNASQKPAKKIEKDSPDVKKETSVPNESPSRKTPSKKSATASGNSDLKGAPVSSSVPPAEEFKIGQDFPLSDEPLPEDLVMAFEENYRSESRLMRSKYIVALVLVVCIAGAWYFISQNPQTASSLKQKVMPVSGAKQAPAKVQVTPPSAPPVQNTTPPPVPPPVAAPALPKFIPADGLDASYGKSKPGWNRYVGKQYEFRVFSIPGRIQAIQVLSLKGAVPASFIQSVLQEFIGSSVYKIQTRSTKDGVRVENGTVQNNGEIVLYRKNGSVKAFVVSVK